jgi:hypothetical protein
MRFLLGKTNISFRYGRILSIFDWRVHCVWSANRKLNADCRRHFRYLDRRPDLGKKNKPSPCLNFPRRVPELGRDWRKANKGRSKR